MNTPDIVNNPLFSKPRISASRHVGLSLTPLSHSHCLNTAALAGAFVLALAAIANPAAAGPTYIGNSLTVSSGGADGSPPLVILGDYDPAGPLATSPIFFPSAGTVTDVQFYGSNYDFTVYALSLVGSGVNEQTFEVDASESFLGSAALGDHTLPASGFSVGAGDLLAFAGIGPFYPQKPNDAVNSDAAYGNAPSSFTATPPGGAGSEFTVGVNGDLVPNYDYIPDVFGNQGRTYGFGVDFSAAQSTVPDSGSSAMLFGLGLCALLIVGFRMDLGRAR